MLGWTNAMLAAKAGMSINTITRVESGSYAFRESTAAKLQAVFESAGIEFIPENGGGAGVRLANR